MSIKDNINKLMSRLSQISGKTRDLEKRLVAMEAQQARRKGVNALAVPPGSNLFGGDDVRMFRVVSVDAENSEALGVLQEISDTGELIDDPDNATQYVVKPTLGGSLPSVGQIIPALFSGLEDDGLPFWFSLLYGFWPQNVELITTSQLWMPPEGVSRAMFVSIGGGGGGGGSSDTPSVMTGTYSVTGGGGGEVEVDLYAGIGRGGGGAGGFHTVSLISGLDPDNGVHCEIGTGGAAGGTETDGSNGGSTLLRHNGASGTILCVAGGGNGGKKGFRGGFSQSGTAGGLGGYGTIFTTAYFERQSDPLTSVSIPLGSHNGSNGGVPHGMSPVPQTRPTTNAAGVGGGSILGSSSSGSKGRGGNGGSAGFDGAVVILY